MGHEPVAVTVERHLGVALKGVRRVADVNRHEISASVLNSFQRMLAESDRRLGANTFRNDTALAI